jgi:hypothetical protein
VHLPGFESTNTWGLPFPFLITHILQRKTVKGTLVDGPITKHPQFGRIQWNQSYSHMPRIPQELVADAERFNDDGVPIDMDEPIVEEKEETITMGISKYQFLCDELSYLWFELADQRREAKEDMLLAYQQSEKQEELLRSILA